ncbi:hypothetical protein BG006_008245 [Podila minutissima]|uniref:Uncharacterized protein n=1 Tax=Podila minutissima TaxID=64525 RepID=A0A9P5SS08_9FUNG|nr:hypothetical protein BG006_008242 [Podila minutissima]KAF9336563.1 hypothetical protein BG006_008245 [Podila minutissima]
MATFFDWITDPHNHERLHKKNPVSGQKPKDIRQEIANIVNKKHNTAWTELQVKSKIAYSKTKYREAMKLNSTGKGARVSCEQLDLCPEFVRLHQVYGGNLAANPPPPRQSTYFGDEPTAYDISDNESSDLEAHDETSDTDVHDDSPLEPVNKRRKGNSITSPEILTTFIDRMQQLSYQHRQAYDENRSELRQRELAIEARERELTEKLLRVAQDLNRLAEEARVRLRQELAIERAEFRKEMAEERAEFKREKAEFSKERDQLKMENAALRKELEVLQKNY